MATLSQSQSRRLYSWWWNSHISPKNSKWLHDDLKNMDTMVKAMIKLIEEDADSFARRAEMYFKKRPELLKLVEEFYRAYRALAERYDHATGVLRQAHKTITEAFPNQIPLTMPEESPSSSGNEVEPHTPEMPPPVRALLDMDDPHSIKRNGAYSESSDASSSRKGLNFEGEEAKDFEHLSHRPKDTEKETREREDMRNKLIALQQEVSCLSTEREDLRAQISSVSERADVAEREVQRLKDVISHLSSEKDDALLQLSKSQDYVEKLKSDMAEEIEKLSSAEKRNYSLQLEVEMLTQKVKAHELQVEQSQKDMENLRVRLQDECQHREQAEMGLISMENLYSQSQEEVKRSVIEIEKVSEKNVHLENLVCMLENEINRLSEQNLSSAQTIKDLNDKTNLLKGIKENLENEIRSLQQTISQLNLEKDEALYEHQLSLERLANLESQLFDAQNDHRKLVNDMAEEVEKRKADEKLLEQKVEMQEKELEQKTEEMNSLHATLYDECRKSSQAEAALRSMEKQHSECKEEVQRLVRVIEELSVQLTKLDQIKVNLENTVNDLKKEIDSLNEAKVSSDVLIRNHRDEISSLKDSKENLENVLSVHLGQTEALQSSNNELKETCVKISEKNVVLENSLFDANAELVDLREKITALDALTRSLNTEISTHISEKVVLSSQVEALSQNIAEASEKKSALESSLTDLNAELEILRAKLKDSSEASLSLVAQNSILATEMDNLFSEVERTSIILKDLENRHADLEDKHSSLIKEKDLKNNQVEELQDLLEIKAREYGSTTMILKSLENSYADLEGKHSTLSREKEAMHDRLKELEDLLNLKSQEHECTTVVLKSLEDRHRDLQNKHMTLSREKEAIRDQLKELQGLLNSWNQQYESTTMLLRDLENRHGDLQDKHSTLLREKEAMHDRLKELEDLLKLKSQEHESTIMVLKSLENRHEYLEDKHSTLSREKEVIHDQLKELCGLLNSRNQEYERTTMLLRDLENRHGGLQDKHSTLLREKEAMHDQLKELEGLLNLKSKEHDSTTMALKSLEDRHGDLEKKHSILSREKEVMHDQLKELHCILNSRNQEYESTIMLLRNLENRHTDLEDRHLTLSREKDATDDQLKELQDLWNLKSQEHESTTMVLKSLENKHGDLEDKHSALSREKEAIHDQLKELQGLLNSMNQQHESTTMLLRGLENRHADLQDKHSALSREKDLLHTQVEELQDLLGLKNQEHEAAVQLHEKQSVTFQDQIDFQVENLEEEQLKNMGALISILILERSLCDMKDKNLAISIECEKHFEASLLAENTISQFKQNAQNQQREQKSLWSRIGKLREGILEIMEALKISQNSESVDGLGDEVLLETVKSEIRNILKVQEESEDANIYMHLEILALATILKEISMDMEDIRAHKFVLEQEIETKVEQLLSLQNKNHELIGMSEGLKQELQTNMIEMENLRGKLLDSEHAYGSLQDEHYNLIEINNSMSKGLQTSLEKFNVLEENYGVILAEAMFLEHLYTFFRSLSEERARELKSITDKMASLCLVKSKLGDEVRLLSRKVGGLEVENSRLTQCLVCVEELFGTRLVVLEFDLNTSKDMLTQKDAEILEENEKVQLLLEKNVELTEVLEALQMDFEGITVVKEDLEKKICNLSKEISCRDNEILCLHGELDRLMKEIEAHKELEEQCEKEVAVLLGDTLVFAVNAAIYEEKILELLMEGESKEICAMIHKDVLLDSILSRETYIDDLKKLAEMEGENMKLTSDLNSCLALVTLLWEGIASLEAHTLSLSKNHKPQGTKETTLSDYYESIQLSEDHSQSASGALKLRNLIAKVDAIQKVMTDIRDFSKQEPNAVAAAQLEANKPNNGINMQKDDGGSFMVKHGQMMKDIELDQISAHLPYDKGAGRYPLSGDEDPVLDYQMLQLWETAERGCINPMGKPSSAATEHDIEVVEEVKSEYPSSKLAAGKEFRFKKLEMPRGGAFESQQEWSRTLLERLTSDAKRLAVLQTGIKELKRKMESSTGNGKLPVSAEYNAIRDKLNETEEAVLEQIDVIESTKKRVKYYSVMGDGIATEQERFAQRRKIYEKAQKGSEEIGNLELELQKIQYVLLKLEEEQEYRRIRVSDKRARVLLRDYLYGRKDSHRQKKKGHLCGCMKPKTKGDN